MSVLNESSASNDAEIQFAIDAEKTLEINPLSILQALRSAGSGVLSLVSLYLDLAQVEWALEKARITSLLTTILTGFAFLLSGLTAATVIICVLSWETPFRGIAITGLVFFYTAALAIIWRRVNALLAVRHSAFGTLRDELATDMAMIKSAISKSAS